MSGQFLDSDYSFKVSYADMDDSSVGEEKERKKRKQKVGTMSREEWEVGQQVWFVMINIGDNDYYDDDVLTKVLCLGSGIKSSGGG